ncbi:MAG TPA: 50S ribosomal protein L29 [Pseudomonadales bacterium]|jgi:large subunit ribosomal protein L29|nr:50S ribosomal protein L29 [Pseudomonadales bacterium]
MKVADLRSKSIAELQSELDKQLKDQFKQKMQLGTGQLSQTHLLKASRRRIAQIKTLLNEKAGE